MSGALFAMGGAVDWQGAAMQAFYAASGGPDGRMVILPTASGEPLQAGQTAAAAFERLGLRTPARILPVQTRQQADEPEYLEAVRWASAIFLTGGNQLRLTARLGGTALLAALQAAHRAGAVVAGTSAGAAALSALMIAFGRSGNLPRAGMAQFAPGLGFSDRVIFDQHFRQRNRLGRLLYAVAMHPGVLGVGVDENTAAVLQDDRLSVVGRHAVTVVDGLSLVSSNVAEISGQQPLALSGVYLHVLTHGCTFDVAIRRAVIPNGISAVD